MRTMSEPKRDPKVSRAFVPSASGMFRRRSHSDEEDETIVRLVLNAVGLSRTRAHRLAGPEILRLSRDLEAGVTLEHDVVLGALLVNVDLLVLSWLEAVDVEEEIGIRQN